MEERVVYRIFKDAVAVSVSKKLIDLYEEKVAPIDARRIEYLAVSGGCDEGATPALLEKEIENGIMEEVEVNQYREGIVMQAQKNGLISCD